MISGDVPKHLVALAKTGFILSMKQQAYDWQRVAQVVNLDQKTETLVDLGGAPMPVNSSSGMTVQDMIEISKTVTAIPWDITVWISDNAVQDDQTGMLEQRVRAAGNNFQKHMNKRVFQVLNAGDASTYGLAYDGQFFFDTDHTDPGAAYTTNQSNKTATNISLDAFETAMVAAKQLRDDQGEFTSLGYDLLVVSPAGEREAAQIYGNREDYATTNRAINPYAGQLKPVIVSPYLDTNAWILVASSEPIKPILLAIREQPHLQSAWFDPKAPDGGRHYFKYYARYEASYGNWRTAFMGQT